MRLHLFLPVVILVALTLTTGCGDDPIPPQPPRETKNPFNNIAFDEQGNTWIGTDEGLFRARGNSIFKTGAWPDTSAIYCLEYREGMLLAATSKGVVSFSIDASNQLSISSILDSSNSLLPSNHVFCMGTDGLHRRWYGTARGISLCEGTVWKTNKAISLNLVILSGVPVTSLAFRAHDLHLATRGKNLVHVILNPETDGVSGASQLLGGQEQSGFNYNGDLTTDTIFCVYTSRDSSNWFGSEKGLTRNKGANRSQAIDAEFDYFLQGQRVHAVLEDSNGKIWAGTETGLFVMEAGNWDQYTMADGLPSDKVESIAEQYDGSIWILTSNGIIVCRNKMLLLLNPA
jgi:ligand-binding sensor domain-containing protein